MSNHSLDEVKTTTADADDGGEQSSHNSSTLTNITPNLDEEGTTAADADANADNDDDDDDGCSNYSSIITQLTPSCSEDLIIHPICIELAAESNSAIIENDAYKFGQAINLDFEKILLEHYAKKEDLKLHGYEKYKHDCETYGVAPISALKKIFDGETELDLSGYGSDTIGIMLIAKSLNGPPMLNITKLDLSYTLFDEGACEALNDFFRTNQTLKHVNFSNCSIGADGIEILADGFSMSPSIEYLSLRNCNLRDEGGYHICMAFKYNDYCKVLDLSYNKLYSNTGIALYTMLLNNTALEELDLSWNELYEEDAIKGLLNGLYENKALKKLNLAWNGIANILFGKLFFRAVRVHPTIEEIDLHDNRLSNVEGSFIAFGMRRAANLKKIYLGHNPWTRDDIATFIRLASPLSPVRYISFGEDFYVTPEERLQIQLCIERNPDLEIVYKAAMMPNAPEPVNFRNILVDRMKFVAMKPKKKKLQRDAGHFMHKLLDQDQYAVKFDEFREMVKSFKIKLDPELIDQCMAEFVVKPKKVLVYDLASYYLERHPTEPPPPPPAKKKKERKGKGKGKDGKSAKKKK